MWGELKSNGPSTSCNFVARLQGHRLSFGSVVMKEPGLIKKKIEVGQAALEKLCCEKLKIIQQNTNFFRASACVFF